MSEPKWLVRSTAISIARGSQLRIGEISEYWLSDNDDVFQLVFGIRISENEYRFYEDENKAKAEYILRGIQPAPPRIKASYGVDILDHKNFTKIKL